jgi:type IV pilus assembly protein PilQ
MPSGPQATQLLGVAAEESDEGTVVRLEADGTLMDVETFVLQQPDRLVLDLVGLSAADVPDTLEIGGRHPHRIRIGEHADKVRVVIDGGGESGPFEGFQARPQADGLVVQLGFPSHVVATADGTRDVQPEEIPAARAEEPQQEPARAQEDAEPIVLTAAPAAAPEPARAPEPVPAVQKAPEAVVAEEEAPEELPGWIQEEVAEETAPEPEEVAVAKPEPAMTGTTIYGIQLDAQGEFDRVVVLSDEPVEHEVVDLDPETLVVRLHGASIDPEAAVRLAPEESGALSLVTAFQQPDVKRPEVRVVMKRAPGLVPEVSQRGTMLFLDFPRGEATASRPPVYQRAPAAPAGPVPQAVARVEERVAPPPAAIDPDEGLGVLQEGGLVEGKQYIGRRISLDFKDVEIDDVLRLIADVSDLNIIAGDEVDGKVTIRLVDVPWDQALDVILLTKGLGFVRVGNVLRIAPSEMLASEEEARLQERRAKEKLEDLIVKLQPVNYANVKEVSQMVKRLLTPRGTVDVDQRTNTVILKDIASVIDEATALIKAIDTQTPQVLIEAKIVEARLDFSREIGSTWAFGAQPFTDGFDPGDDRRDQNIGNDVVFHDNPLLTGFTDTFNHVQVANPITSVANGLLDLGAFILDEQFNLELRLEAAESNGDGKVISSPRVVTLDNREAEIQQGVSIPFQTFENGDAQLEFVDAVLKLKVTPHITADRSIIMDIEVERNAPDDSVQTPTGSPAIAKNEAKTETLVKDGQTLVIGGIYVISKSDRTSGVPFFNKIPLLGAAFRNVETRDQRNELLIFVTPRVVVNPELAS